MPLPRGRSKDSLHKLYGDQKNSDLHHLIPGSRAGETNEFNLFPFNIKSHRAYHILFLNMTIWEIWEVLDGVHEEIFNNEEERVSRPWLHVCHFSKERLDTEVDRFFPIEFLQQKWITTFGRKKLNRARKLLKRMMLFMVFGSEMADPEQLFDDGHLMQFFQKYPVHQDRLRAFNICFGKLASLDTIKYQIFTILR